METYQPPFPIQIYPFLYWEMTTMNFQFRHIWNTYIRHTWLHNKVSINNQRWAANKSMTLSVDAWHQVLFRLHCFLATEMRRVTQINVTQKRAIRQFQTRVMSVLLKHPHRGCMRHHQQTILPYKREPPTVSEEPQREVTGDRNQGECPTQSRVQGLQPNGNALTHYIHWGGITLHWWPHYNILTDLILYFLKRTYASAIPIR